MAFSNEWKDNPKGPQVAQFLKIYNYVKDDLVSNGHAADEAAAQKIMIGMVLSAELIDGDDYEGSP